MPNSWSIKIYYDPLQNFESIVAMASQALNSQGYVIQKTKEVNPKIKILRVSDQGVIEAQYGEDVVIEKNTDNSDGVALFLKDQEYDLHLNAIASNPMLSIGTLGGIREGEDGMILAVDMKAIFRMLCDQETVSYGIGTSEWTMEGLFRTGDADAFKRHTLVESEVEYLFWLNYFPNSRCSKNLDRLAPYLQHSTRLLNGVIIESGAFPWTERAKKLTRPSNN